MWVKIQGQPSEEVERFTYFRSDLERDLLLEKDFRSRIKKTSEI